MDTSRHDVRTVIVALVVSLLVAGGPALAQQVVRASGTAQPRCKPGAVLAYADFDPSNATSTYSLHGVLSRFNCADSQNRVLVKKSSPGIYLVAFPGISDATNNAGNMVAEVSVSGGSGRTIGYFNEEDPRGHIIEVDTELNGSFEDDIFAITLFGFQRG